MANYVCAALLVVLLTGATAQSNSWRDLFSFPYTTTPSIALDISCVDTTHCYVAGGDNGIGAMVYRFDGQPNGTFHVTNISSKPLMLMTVALDGTAASPKGVAAGLGLLTSGILYALGPDSFSTSLDGSLLGQSQNARALASGAVLVIGVGSSNAEGGVAFSSNGGVSFTNVNIPITAPGGGWVRYGALVDANTWYVTFGGWPNNNNNYGAVNPADVYPYSARFGVHKTEKRIMRAPRLARRDNKDGYSALIAKTTDGGKTWTTLFSDNSTYYFNAIDCLDALRCVTVAEGFDANPGVKVFQTTDGRTWNVVFNLPSTATTSYTFMATRYVSSSEIWVGGGQDEQLSSTALFYKSLDGGKTWGIDSKVTNVDAVSALDFTPDGNGFACGVTIDERSTVMRYSKSTH